MMKKSLWKKATALGLATIMTASMFAGCGGNDSESKSDNKTSKNDEVEMDLGGMEIVIGDWWTDPDAEPESEYEEARAAYREEIQEKYNFKMTEKAIAEWGTMQETFIQSTLAEDPAAQIFCLNNASIAQPMANGLFYDLATLDSLDFTDDRWNEFVMESTTIGDSIYGMRAQKAEPRAGVYWNKRLFREAGLDEDLPYDLQKSGDWTWDKFAELCKVLTYDKNMDGTMDSYAMASFSVTLYGAAIASNGAKYVDKDENGNLVNATGTAAFTEAMQWVTSLVSEGYEKPTEEGANWDWYISAFHDGQVAMTVSEEYQVSMWADMDDDWGFVLFPKGPKADNYTEVFSDNVYVIPACYDEETAEKIAFAYNLWMAPVPGYEEEDSWKDEYYTAFRDERAVDETLALMYEDGVGTVDYISMVYGITAGDIVFNTYGLWVTPAEQIESIKGTWDQMIADANKK